MSQAFARAIAMMALIQASISSGKGMPNLAPYESRGHGLGKLGKRYIKNRSKYQPHYGAKESAKFCAKQA